MQHNNQTLALPAPFGADSSVYAHLILTVKGIMDETEAKHEMMQFGCPERFADRAVSCLRHSGRYDCYLQRSWVVYEYTQGSVVQRFADIGLDFHIDEFCPPLRQNTRRTSAP